MLVCGYNVIWTQTIDGDDQQQRCCLVLPGSHTGNHEETDKAQKGARKGVYPLCFHQGYLRFPLRLNLMYSMRQVSIAPSIARNLLRAG